jgi:hypothetical protein
MQRVFGDSRNKNAEQEAWFIYFPSLKYGRLSANELKD